ncbi:MAG: hypothetical protein UY54_C0008G0020 [Parcubacteria group bacterium GW2011_GWA2_50_10b]|nr:MAG: hypothetical protein UY54_C0008G0020 [Parcubacteria group bacterium GW2011_GWA2_50_10b]
MACKHRGKTYVRMDGKAAFRFWPKNKVVLQMLHVPSIELFPSHIIKTR